MSTHEILPWDSEFFGFAVARMDARIASHAGLAQAMAELREHAVRLAYWLPPMSEQAAQLARQHGGTLVGGHARYEHEIVEPPTQASCALPIAPVAGSEVAPDLLALAVGAGRLSRFALDPRMPSGTVERMYGIWIRRSLAGEIADAVLAARDAAGHAVGLATVARESAQGVIGLVAVAPEWQGRGVGRGLMDAAASHFARAGIRRARVTTQTENAAACALYEACGYTRAATSLVAHFWL
jgi:ribosomal protein S18 acetylase RimI-like enzyme